MIISVKHCGALKLKSSFVNVWRYFLSTIYTAEAAIKLSEYGAVKPRSLRQSLKRERYQRLAWGINLYPHLLTNCTQVSYNCHACQARSRAGTSVARWLCSPELCCLEVMTSRRLRGFEAFCNSCSTTVSRLPHSKASTAQRSPLIRKLNIDDSTYLSQSPFSRDLFLLLINLKRNYVRLMTIVSTLISALFCLLRLKRTHWHFSSGWFRYRLSVASSTLNFLLRAGSKEFHWESADKKM